jgi:putative transposase
MFKVVHDPAEPNVAGGSMLDEIVRDGARQMLAAALQAEVAAYVEACRGGAAATGQRQGRR